MAVSDERLDARDPLLGTADLLLAGIPSRPLPYTTRRLFREIVDECVTSLPTIASVHVPAAARRVER